MKLIYTVLISIVCSSIIMACGLWYNTSNKPKFGYIELGEVFEKFDLKNELSAKLKRTLTARQKIADSIEVDLKVLSKKIEDEKGKNKDNIHLFEVKRENYYKQKRKTEEDNDALTKEYDKQIRTQLSQYVIEFGKAFNYRFIFGSDGNGSLMYGTDGENITKQVTEFINKKYKGVN
jgi:outer membrane protein